MVNNGFVSKKVDTLTLGEKLKKLRTEALISVGDVAKHTKIQNKYIEYLESGRYDKLPADVYIKGFLRSYAAFLGVNDKALIKLYERERGIQKNIGKNLESDKMAQPLKISTFAITSKMVTVSLILLGALSGFIYLYREVNSFVSTPRLILDNPADGMKSSDQSLSVSGETDKGAKLFINDQSAIVDENGRFQETVQLQPGLNIISLRSVNKFDKEIVRAVSVQGEFEATVADHSNGAESTESREAPMKLEVVMDIKKTTWLSIEADGNLVYTGTPETGFIQSFEAQNQIRVSAGNGALVGIRLGDRELDKLGKEGEVVRDKVFTQRENKS